MVQGCNGLRASSCTEWYNGSCRFASISLSDRLVTPESLSQDVNALGQHPRRVRRYNFRIVQHTGIGSRGGRLFARSQPRICSWTSGCAKPTFEHGAECYGRFMSTANGVHAHERLTSDFHPGIGQAGKSQSGIIPESRRCSVGSGPSPRARQITQQCIPARLNDGWLLHRHPCFLKVVYYSAAGGIRVGLVQPGH